MTAVLNQRKKRRRYFNAQRFSRNAEFTVRSALKFLDLPFGTRWEAAAARIKEFIVELRKTGDCRPGRPPSTEARLRCLSRIKALLKKRLYKTCTCGVAIRHDSLLCTMCDKSGRAPRLKAFAA